YSGTPVMEPPADLYELLALRLFFESRFASGNKLSTTVSLLGSKTPNETRDDRLANTLGVDFFYKMPLGNDYSWGFYFGGEGGLDTSVVEDEATETKTTTEFSGLYARIAVFFSM